MPRTAPDASPLHGYQRAERKDALVRRLRRIEGQVRGVERMLDEGRYCVEIMAQIEAVTAALARVQDEVLDAHLSHCVSQAMAGEDPEARREKLDEVVGLLRKYRRAR